MEEQLSNLKEISLPEPVAYTPQTVGWYLLLALAILVAVLLIIRWRRNRLRNRYRSEALGLLNDIEESNRPLSELPALVKRVALAFAPREKIAELSGAAWLRFLDSTLGGTDFSDGPGRLLLTVSYATTESVKQKVTPEQRSALLSLIRRWIRRHRAGI
jgi:hypothetical protein